MWCYPNLKADAPESYDIPSRGRHYSEVWDDEDEQPLGTTPRFPVPNWRPSASSHSHGGLALPHFVPVVEMRDENLHDEYRGLGNLTERIVAAVVGRSDSVTRHDGLALKGDVSEYDGNREASRVDVVELEDRMKKELRALMLLGEHEEVIPCLCRRVALIWISSSIPPTAMMMKSRRHFDNVSVSFFNKRI